MKQMKKKLLAILAGVTVLTVAMPMMSWAAPVNLVKNGSFESAVNLKSTAKTDWVYHIDKRDKATGITAKKDAAGASDGQYGLYFDGSTPSWAGISQDIEVKANSYYKLLYSTNLTGGRVQAYVCVIKSDGYDGQRLWQEYGRQDGTIFDYGSWFEEKSTMISTGKNTKVRLVILAAEAEREPKQVKGYIDNVRLYETDSSGVILGSESTSTTNQAAGTTTSSVSAGTTASAGKTNTTAVNSSATTVSTQDTNTGSDPTEQPGDTTAGSADAADTTTTRTTTASDKDTVQDDVGGIHPGVIVAIVVGILGIAAVVVVLIVKKRGKTSA